MADREIRADEVCDKGYTPVGLPGCVRGLTITAHLTCTCGQLAYVTTASYTLCIDCLDKLILKVVRERIRP